MFGKNLYNSAGCEPSRKRRLCNWIFSLISENALEIFAVTAGLIAIHFIFVFKAFREGESVTATGAGLLGDFVGGYVGTFVGLFSVVLLIRTLRGQTASNRLMSFEAKYFQLLQLHRSNVDEMELDGDKGRKVFVVLVREFRLIFDICRRIAIELQVELNNVELSKIAYICLYIGTGPNSTRVLRSSLRGFDQGFVENLVTHLSCEERKDVASRERRFKHVPFEGHQSRLGHYFRLLYQTVKYVDQQEFLGVEDKYEYVKTVRAQLSNHEQVILLLNCISPLGAAWIQDGFLSNYRLVKNIPTDFFDPESELNIRNLFRPKYFEWDNVD